MHIYVNAKDLVAAGLLLLCGFILLVAYLLDEWCNRHMGHPIQKWLYRTLLKK